MKNTMALFLIGLTPMLTNFSYAGLAHQSFAITHGKIDFYSIGKPSMLKIHGETDQMTGSLELTNETLEGSFEVSMKSFSTGMSLRDDHLKKKVFEVDRFEKAKVTLDPLAFKSQLLGSQEALPFTGKLAFHGLEKPIRGTATIKNSASLIEVSAEFSVKLTDFAIAPPEFMGMSIQDEVKISATGDAKK
jgi:polyisoprenoid-binding protein YceI